MEQLKQTVEQMLALAGFQNLRIEVDAENRKIAVFIDEGEWFKKVTPHFVNSIDHVARLIAKKNNLASVFVDVNNYRREREHLIMELAQAAARKALVSKAPVELPPMNAYERRLVHVELASRPDIKTESIGEGKTRHVIVSPSGL